MRSAGLGIGWTVVEAGARPDGKERLWKRLAMTILAMTIKKGERNQGQAMAASLRPSSAITGRRGSVQATVVP